MRKIKFKAKRVDNGEWVYGGITSRMHSPNDKVQIVSCEHDEGEEENEHYTFIEVYPDTVCQYTGLKDKDGNELWHNDTIVQNGSAYILRWCEKLNLYALFDPDRMESPASYPFYGGDAKFVWRTGNIHDLNPSQNGNKHL